MKEKTNKNIFQKIGGFFKKCFMKVKEFFGGLKEKISHSKLYTLVMMQLKDKWNFSFKTNKKASLFKLSGYLIVFGVITAVVYLIMDISASKLGIFVGNKIPLNAMIPLLLVLTFFEAASIFVGMTRALFFAKDNVVLITYPVKSDYLFISKIIVYYIDALKKSFTLFFPVLISFGIIHAFPIYYYFWILILDLLYVGVLVLFIGLLSIPGRYILRFLDKYRFVKIFFSLVIVAALIYGTIKLIDVIPSNINLIKEYEKFSRGLNDTLLWFETNFHFFKSITYMLVGVRKGLKVVPMSLYSLFGFLIMVGAIGVLVLANSLLSKPFYHKMIATSNNSKNSKKNDRPNHASPRFFSILKYELMRIVRDEKLIAASLICIVVMPLFTLIANKVYSSFDTRVFGEVLIFIFNFFFIFLVAASHNVSSSYIFSKDGPSWTVNKTMPVNPKMSLSLRLVYNMLVSLAIIIPSSIIFFKRITFHGDGYSLVLFILAIFALSTFHSILSASYDYSHSKNKDKADIGSEIVTTHETISLAYGFIIGVVAALFLIIFALTGSKHSDLRIFLIALVLLVFESWFFLHKVRLTYQEN